jgi:beta-lactamase superfamily II metal-dependent hydrolase
MRSANPFGRSLAPLLVLALVLAYSSCAFAQLGNGKLQVHHIDVGQGDGILIISPQGQLAIVDDAAYNNCAPFVNYITGLGVTDFDYNFASHYHADHT